MSTVKADNFTWKTGEATAQVGSSVTGPQIVYGVAKSWTNFTTATTTSARASFNVSSLTDNGGGDTSITLAISMLDSSYVTATSYNMHEGGTAGYNSSLQTYLASKTSTVCRVRAWYGSGGGATDTTDQNVTIFR